MGVDKLAVDVGGLPLIERALSALSGAGKVIAVGPRRPLSRDVVWTWERPRGAGPVAALAAGLDLCRQPLIAALAADMPFVSPEVIAELIDARGGGDGAILVDAGGRDQFLCAIYRADALRNSLSRMPAEHGSMRELLKGIDLRRVSHSVAAMDCDTWDEVEQARAQLGGVADAG